jgi:hypothetical protein
MCSRGPCRWPMESAKETEATAWTPAFRCWAGIAEKKVNEELGEGERDGGVEAWMYGQQCSAGQSS